MGDGKVKMEWAVTTEFMKQAASDNKRRQELEVEVDRLRATVERQDRILAALREPSEAVLDAAWREARVSIEFDDMRNVTRAALAAAEQEVDREA